MTKAYIGVGSNIDPEYNLPKALQHLQNHVRVEAVATVYRTAPIGRPDQPAYLNTVWQIRTNFLPRHLKFAVLRRIETTLGRGRTQDRYHARTIDLDLLLYGELVIREADLVIPDPDIRQRPFLAIPLFELNPALILPDTQEKLQHVVATFSSAELQAVSAITSYLKHIVNDE